MFLLLTLIRIKSFLFYLKSFSFGLTQKWASLKAQSVNNLPAHARDLGSIPGSGRSPGEGNGNPLQYSYLENSMDRRAWRATVRGVTRVGDDLVTKSSSSAQKWI